MGSGTFIYSEPPGHVPSPRGRRTSMQCTMPKGAVPTSASTFDGSRPSRMTRRPDRWVPLHWLLWVSCKFALVWLPFFSVGPTLDRQ